jgi:Kelch motif/Galactose oxidase, central domain
MCSPSRPDLRRVLVVSLALAAVAMVAASVAACGGDERQEQAEPWTLAKAMSQRRSYVAAAAVDSSIYVAGGMVGGSGRALSIFQRFDPAANRWTTLEPLPDPVRAAAAAAIDDTVYVIGGSGGDGGRGSVYTYDIDRRSWSLRAPLPEPRLNHAAVALGGKIYVLGGFAHGREQGDVFRYDPVADSWSPVAALPRPLHAFDAVAFRGEIWVIGGRRGERMLRDVWILNPAVARWRRGPSMPRAIELLGVAVVGDQIHAVWEHVYLIYDASTARWSQGPRPRVPRHALQTFFVDGALYTIGGCTPEPADSPIVERRALQPPSRS